LAYKAAGSRAAGRLAARAAASALCIGWAVRSAGKGRSCRSAPRWLQHSV